VSSKKPVILALTEPGGNVRVGREPISNPEIVFDVRVVVPKVCITSTLTKPGSNPPVVILINGGTVILTVVAFASITGIVTVKPFSSKKRTDNAAVGSKPDPVIVRRLKGAAELVDSDEIVSPVGGGDCVTLKVCPAMVMVPVRGLVSVLTDTV